MVLIYATLMYQREGEWVRDQQPGKLWSC